MLFGTAVWTWFAFYRWEHRKDEHCSISRINYVSLLVDEIAAYLGALHPRVPTPISTQTKPLTKLLQDDDDFTPCAFASINGLSEVKVARQKRCSDENGKGFTSLYCVTCSKGASNAREIVAVCFRCQELHKASLQRSRAVASSDDSDD